MTALLNLGIILLAAVFSITNDYNCLGVPDQESCRVVGWCTYNYNTQKCEKDLCLGLDIDTCVPDNSYPYCRTKYIQFGCSYDETYYCVGDGIDKTNEFYDCFYNYMKTGSCSIPELPAGYCVLVTTEQGTYCTEDDIEDCSTYTADTCSLNLYCTLEGTTCVYDPCFQSFPGEDGTCAPNNSCVKRTVYHRDGRTYNPMDLCMSSATASTCFTLSGDYLDCGEDSDFDAVCTGMDGCAITTVTRNGVSRKLCTGQATGDPSRALSVRSRGAAAKLIAAFFIIGSVVALFQKKKKDKEIKYNCDIIQFSYFYFVFSDFTL